MTTPPDSAAPPAPYLHEESGTVRFWVLTEGGKHVGATISKQTLHFRFHAQMSGADAEAIYLANREIIDAAVRSRVARGSIEPVMLREFDVAPPQVSRP